MEIALMRILLHIFQDVQNCKLEKSGPSLVALHGETLSTSGLAVCDDSTVESLCVLGNSPADKAVIQRRRTLIPAAYTVESEEPPAPTAT